MQRPMSVVIFGVLNIVFSVFGGLGTAISAAVVFGGVFPEAAGVAAAPIFELWVKIAVVVSGIGAVALLASGIGLLMLRLWGRLLAVGYSIYTLVTTVLAMAMQWVFVVQPTLARFQGQEGPERIAALSGAVGGTVGGCIGLIYPLLLWYFMTRSHVVAAFAGIVPARAEPQWTPTVEEAAGVTDSSNPFVSPRTDPRLPMASSTSDSIVETFVPSKNAPALASYYLGLFALLPCLGFPLGVAAVYYGIQGLRRVRQNPAVRGGAHAWVGVICGSLFGLFNFVLLVIAIVGGISVAVRG